MIVVGTTCAPFKASGPFADGMTRWLSNSMILLENAAAFGEDLIFFAALETDARGLDPYQELLAEMEPLPSVVWWFSMDDNEKNWATNLRTLRVTTGRNMVVEYAMRNRASHILFLDTDVRPDADTIRKLMMVDWPIVGGDVPAYCLSGTPVLMKRRWEGHHRWKETLHPYGFQVEEHWNTAGYLLIRTLVFEFVRWGWSPIGGLSDDPWFARAVENAGFGPTLVRKDCIGDHEPLGSLESRGEDLVIRK